MSSRNLRAVRMFFLHNWPQKLGSLLAAGLVWWFATVSEAPQTQASRVVSIEVQGLGSTSVARGLPETAVLTIRGPSLLIERLQPGSLGAVIDLTGTSGDFEEPINVVIPRGVELVSVTPSDVIGTVETLTEMVVPVEAVLIGEGNPDTLAEVTLEPGHVTVSGLASELQRVSRVHVPVRAVPGTVQAAGFAADEAGLPVPGVTITPAEVEVAVTDRLILTSRTVALELVPPSVPGFNVAARLETAEVTVTGLPSLLEGLGTIRVTADLSGIEPEAGTFTVPVELGLPDTLGVSSQPQAIIRFTPLALEE